MNLTDSIKKKENFKVPKHSYIGNYNGINNFYKKIEKVNNSKPDTVRIFHFGDSHIKGGYMTGVIKERFREDFGGKVVYNSLGINGASFETFNKKEDFEKILKSEKPDLIIISLGTNDASGENFDENYFLKTVAKLVQTIFDVLPDIDILMTTAPDYQKNNEPNKFVPIANYLIIRFCEENNFAYWDIFETMGGLGSSQNWFEQGYMAKDKIHFTVKGYELIGEIFYQDLME
jgi:lysophospholipase L1-like esterase